MIIMEWYNLLRKISVVGAVLSVIFMILSYLLFYRELRNPKNSHKLIKDTSLDKLLDISFITTISFLIFDFILIFLW
jgi:formate-dependent nitrite reductase membrane component NrfD